MPKAFSYIRFSRPEQLRGDSLRRQIAKADAWAAKRGVVIDESLRDIGVSAFRGANRIKGALGRFHDLVEKGEVPRGSYLIIESLDRFSRKTAREVLPDFLSLINAGIVIVTLIDGQEYSDESIDKEPMGLFGSLMVIMRAHDESRTKADRLSEVWAAKRSAAADAATVMSARLPGWLHAVEGGGKRRIEFRPAEDGRPDGRDLVRRVFVETISGYGRRTIATRLTAAGYSTFEGGKRWHASYVLKILQNRAAYGEHQSYRRDKDGKRVPAGAPIPGYYPAAVTETEFVRANTARENRAPAAGRRGAVGVANLLRGIARCRCGAKMARVNKGPAPKGASYLVCANAARGACGNTRRWRLDWVEDKVLGRTSRIDLAKVLAKSGDNGKRGPTFADLEAKVKDLSTRLARVAELAELGVDGSKERAIALSKELKEAKAARSAAKALGARLAQEPSLAQRQFAMAALQARLEAATVEERVEIRTRLAQEVRGAFEAVVFEPLAIRLKYKGILPRWGKFEAFGNVTVTVYTEDPDELIDMASTELDAEDRAAQDCRVAEFLRRARIRREQVAEDFLGEDFDVMPRL